MRSLNLIKMYPSIWVLCCAHFCGMNCHFQQRSPRTATVQLRYSGFPAFEPDILPYAVIQRIQQQQQLQQHARLGRYMPPGWVPQAAPRPATKHNAMTRGSRKRPQHIPTSLTSTLQNSSELEVNWSTTVKPELRLERSQLHAQLYHLYDVDGEHLLDVKLHVDDDEVTTAATDKSGSTVPRVARAPEYVIGARVPPSARQTMKRVKTWAKRLTTPLTAHRRQHRRQQLPTHVRPHIIAEAPQRVQQHYWLHW